MIWNKEKIISILNILVKKIKECEDEENLLILKRDYIIALEVIKGIDYESYLYFNSLIEINYLEFNKYFNQNQINNAEAILENKNSIFNLAMICENYKLHNIPFFFKRKMPIDLYLETVRVFFKSLSKEYYELYLKLVEEGNLHFTQKIQDLYTAKGVCYPIYSLKDAFIAIDFKRKDNIETLPHEIAHSYEISKIEDFSKTLNWQVSTFRESYPCFIELIFLDFCLEKFKNDKYVNLFINAKRAFFEGIKAKCEYYLNTISRLESYDLRTDNFICNNNEYIWKYDLELLICEFLSIYMFNLYKNDKEEFKTFLDNFNFIKVIDDYLIWEMLNFEKMKDALVEEVKVLQREIVFNNTRRKQKDFSIKIINDRI